MITSSQNSKIKLVRALFGRAKERREAEAFVVEGVRLVDEAVNSNWGFKFALYSDDLSEHGKQVAEKLQNKNIDVEKVESNLFRKLSGTESPQGILAVINDSQLPFPDPANFILIPDQIRDPGNLGTLLRTAAATGVDAVLLPPETTDAFAPKVVRSGMGAHFQLPIHPMTWDEIRERTQNVQVYLADMDGKSYWETDLSQSLALIIGSEADGASAEAQNLATQKISIPMAKNVESLNAGVAGS
ncbi:MAG TPA: RNA methyltransferase, partial [Anaerolineales bacterium]|nr:RNA methyltransferase [Anaerolineales bacterium]